MPDFYWLARISQVAELANTLMAIPSRATHCGHVFADRAATGDRAVALRSIQHGRATGRLATTIGYMQQAGIVMQLNNPQFTGLALSSYSRTLGLSKVQLRHRMVRRRTRCTRMRQQMV